MRSTADALPVGVVLSLQEKRVFNEILEERPKPGQGRKNAWRPR